MTSISTTDLRDRLGEPGLTIVDVRRMAAYNGWRLHDEPRGGHLPGAVVLPSAWLTSVDDAEIERQLLAKGIVPDRTIVVYGDGPDDAALLRDRLAASGYGDVLTYDAGFPAWAADDSLPVERLPQYQKLVYTEWLRELIDGGRPTPTTARATSSSTSTSGSPRSTRRTTSPAPCTSIPIVSRTPRTGTAAPPP